MTKTVSALLLGVSALSLSAPASANEIAETGVPEGDVIVVTGQRTEAPAARQPLRIDVLDRDALDSQNIASLAEALESLAGVATVQGGPAGSQASVFTRGTNSKHTLALYDGIRLNDPSAPSGAFDFGQDLLGDVERIEIARGPLSSLYGSDAVGGVVNLIPRLGGDEAIEGYGAFSVGEFDTVRGLLGASGSTERARYNVTVEAMETEGYNVTPERMTATNTGERDGSDFVTITANGEYDLAPGWTASGLVRLRESTAEFDTFSGGPGFSQRADDPDLAIENDYAVWRTGLEWAAADERFTSTLRGGQVISDRKTLNDGPATDLFVGERTFIEWLNVWRPEIAALTDPSVSFGAQFEREKVTNDGEFTDPLTRGEDSAGLYALGAAGLTEALQITVSGRVDDYEGFGTHATWNAGAVYEIAATGTQVFASYGTAFAAPTLSERFDSSGFVTPNLDLEPEESQSWEIGARTALDLGGRPDSLRFGASYYETEIEDLIESVYDPETFLSQNRNVGEADISGWEAFIDWRPVDIVSLRADYAHVDAKNASTDSRLLRRPAHSYSIRARLDATERLSVSARYAYVGSRLDTTYDDDGFFVTSGGRIESYELVNLSADYEISEGLEAFASVSNLLDETYEQPAAFAGAPRQATVGLRARF